MVEKRHEGGVSYHIPGHDYFEQRELRRHAGVLSLWALGVGAVISGEFSGWNLGFAVGGWGGMFIGTIIIAAFAPPLTELAFKFGPAEYFSLMVLGLIGAWINWPALRDYGHAHFLTPRFLGMVWVMYPMMKAVHELGHALMLRRFGCEVPEVGVNFFMFVPMPYVDASASNKLTSRSQRALVAGAGIMVEAFLALVGLCCWLLVEDGVFREVLFTLMTLGGLSTMLFNGNPLMKLVPMPPRTRWSTREG